MRDAFVKSVFEIASRDRNLILLTADLGFGVLTDFAKAFPKQYFNVGVAEQNMTGLASGLALEGKTVFTYSIGNFPTLRCLEQIRNDVCYHQANVKVVCVGGGFCYGAVGMSHHATEDLAIMRALPHMKVLAPGDTVEAAWATKMAYEIPGPVYLRLGRAGGATIHESDSGLQFGKAALVRGAVTNAAVALLSTGEILDEVIKAHEILASKGVSTSVYSVHSLKPFDRELIHQLIETSMLVVTVEEHNRIGGLGGATAEVMAEISHKRPPLLRIGLEDCFSCEVGDQDYLRTFYGLSSEAIADRVRSILAA